MPYGGRAVAATGLSPQAIADKAAAGELDFASFDDVEDDRARAVLEDAIEASLARIEANAAKRCELT